LPPPARLGHELAPGELAPGESSPDKLLPDKLLPDKRSGEPSPGEPAPGEPSPGRRSSGERSGELAPGESLLGEPGLGPLPERGETRLSGRFWAALAPPAPDSPLPVVVSGIRLGDSVTVVLPAGGRAPTADDLAAIQDAAAPLLAVLRQRGLDGTEGNAHDNAR